MWQKLRRIDTIGLERARIQLQNAIQLVAAGPRSYLSHSQKKEDWLQWNEKPASFESISFGNEPKVKLTLDIEQFVLSIYGDNDHIEHLVLSGVTYPMAFGWLKVKLETFSLDADLYNDETSYDIEYAFGSNDDLNVTDQQVFADLVTYYSNAYHLFNKLNEGLELDRKIRIDPATLNMVLNTDKSIVDFNFGFSLGDKQNPFPFYFIQMHEGTADLKADKAGFIGKWNHENWNGLIISSNEFLNTNTDVEEKIVSDFFMKNYWKQANI